MSGLLILTVGTGTLGPSSNLAQGLVNTIHQLKPRHYWLVPSSSPESIAVAQMVREQGDKVSSSSRWDADSEFASISEPDDLFACRSRIRAVIQQARRDLRSGERLVVNPTSGTKQMSVGATLAALDEEIGEIVFTVGRRADGVVVTGTETMKPFSTLQFLQERDLSIASELFGAGAFYAVERLLKPYHDPEVVKARQKAACMHNWQRLDYQSAASHAAKFSESTRQHLSRLAKADEMSLARLGDLIGTADALDRWGDKEEALARYYRAAEHSAKIRLWNALELRPPYALEDILERLPRGSPWAEVFRNRAHDGTVLLGAKMAWELLATTDDPMADDYFANKPLQRGLMLRNTTMYGHGQDSVPLDTLRDVSGGLKALLNRYLPETAQWWDASHRPQSLC